jgi:beta-glucosidase
MILLKNNGILPLDKKASGKIAVVGPAADRVTLGGYSGFGIPVTTPLRGIQNLVGDRCRVRYARGCAVTDDDSSDIAQAVACAQWADMVIVCVGNIPLKTEGEGFDRSDLRLPGSQEQLIVECTDTGTPVVVVLAGGSAVIVERWIEHVDAVICGWYSGQEGGTALAEILFGTVNPGGKLPISFPRATGQLPYCYNYKSSGRQYDYCDRRGAQFSFPFGHGLSYTEFTYENMDVSFDSCPGSLPVHVSIDIVNTGGCGSEEVVQLYIHDMNASVTRPVKELKAFERVALGSGERKTLTFILGSEELGLFDRDLTFIVEPGECEIMIGSSSEDIRERKTVRIGEQDTTDTTPQNTACEIDDMVKVTE